MTSFPQSLAQGLRRGVELSRVRITITVKGPDDKDIKLSSQARLWMQEVLNFTNSGS